MGDAVLSVRNLNKGFFGVKVLKDVSFEVQKGHVLGLLGENGSGKSTTMNVIGGILQRDSGTIEFAGAEVAPKSARAAQALGIAFIHQELSLFPNLSIEENIFLDHFPLRAAPLPLIDRRAMRSKAQEALKLVGLETAPQVPVSRLPQGERQLVEIAKALTRDAKLIIFDEPTTSLTSPESRRLFEIIARLRSNGISMIYISHILGDVLRICDDIVVLRDGQVIATEPAGKTTIERIVAQMVGRSIDNLFPDRERYTDFSRSALSLRAVSQPRIVRNISFDLHPGEVLGISGLMGSGRSELARIIFGLDRYGAGEISVNGRRLRPGSPRVAMDAGIAFLTEDRRSEGLIMEASISENILLPSLPKQALGFLHYLKPTQIAAVAKDMSVKVKVRAASIDRTAVRALSGGNQQKVVIGKWLLTAPHVFILDEPTRGIDVGAKYEVYKIINQLVADGAAVLMISSEIEELIGMADRIMVMSRGESRGFFDRNNFDREALMRAALWD